MQFHIFAIGVAKEHETEIVEITTLMFGVGDDMKEEWESWLMFRRFVCVSNIL